MCDVILPKKKKKRVGMPPDPSPQPAGGKRDDRFKHIDASHFLALPCEDKISIVNRLIDVSVCMHRIYPFVVLVGGSLFSDGIL